MRTDAKYTPLSIALLVYMAFVVLILTFMPFRFKSSINLFFLWTVFPGDFIANIFLFLPLGFLCKLSRKEREDPSCLKELFYGTLFSLFIETSQMFLDSRCSSISDILANGLGAFLGGKAFNVTWAMFKEKEIPKVTAIELPLIGSVYLLMPLLWINSVLAIYQPSRLWLQLPLGLLGTGIFASIYHFRLKFSGHISIKRFTTIVTAWFFVSSFPLRLHIFSSSRGILKEWPSLLFCLIC